jgi:signal recognition particle subunit SRP54
MFDNLSDKLGGVFDKLKGRGHLKEEDVDAAMREIRVALLEADVALPVVKQFIENVREKAVGQEVIKSVKPGEQVVKIVNDEMVEMLGGEAVEGLTIDVTPPAVFMLVGLQGSGKTTSTAKIAKFLSDKHNKRVLMASLDVARPAAQDQLAQLGAQTGIETLEIVQGQKPRDIAKRAMDEARKGGYDTVLLDTAGRLAIDEDLMREVADIRDIARPHETLLVTDAMAGQDAVTTAQEFQNQVGLSGIMLTRVDGDARGGAAMSMKAVTGKPIKLMGVGEKVSEIEPFYPDRIANRILGMGDVVSLVEKASESIDSEEAEKMAEKFQKGKFDFDDLLAQFRQMKKMGGMGAIMKMLPGMGKMAKQMGDMDMDDAGFKRFEAIIQSMTRHERKKPGVLNASRKKRIAAGSGTSVQEINKLVKQHQQMEKMMKQMRKQGMGGMMQQMKSMMGAEDAQALEQLADQDPEAALEQQGASQDTQGPLGPNPFATGGQGGIAGSMPGIPGGGQPQMPGLPGGAPGGAAPGGGAKRGATKSDKKKRRQKNKKKR